MWFLISARICAVSSLEKRRRRENLFGDANANLDVAVEADAVARDFGIRRLVRRRFADVVQQRAPRQRGRRAGGELLQQQHGVDPDVAFGVELGRLGDAAQPHHFRQDACQQAELVEQLEAAGRAAFGEDPRQLVAHALGRDLVDVGGFAADAFDLEMEVQAGGEADGAQQAQLVFGVAKLGVADGADHAAAQVVAAVDIIEHGRVEVAGGFVARWGRAACR